MGLIYKLLLVYFKHCMSSACLFHGTQCIENSWLRRMTDFNNIRYRAVIEFLTLENVQPQQIHNRMTVVYMYNEDVPSYATIKRCAADFCWGRTSLEVEPGSECPSEAVSKENCHAVENIVLQNYQVSVQLIADTVGISACSVKTILGEHLLMTEVCAWWVSRMFDQKTKDYWCKASCENLKLMLQNPPLKLWSPCDWNGICLWGA